MKLQHVYETWVALGRCSAAKLAAHLGITEAIAAQKLTQAIVAHASGVFKDGGEA